MVTYAADESARALIAASAHCDYGAATLIVDDIVTSPRDAVEAVVAFLAIVAANGIRSSAALRGLDLDRYLADHFAACAMRAEVAG